MSILPDTSLSDDKVTSRGRDENPGIHRNVETVPCSCYMCGQQFTIIPDFETHMISSLGNHTPSSRGIYNKQLTGNK